MISINNSSIKERLLHFTTNILFIFLIFVFFISIKYAVINTLLATFLTILIIISIKINSLLFRFLTFSITKFIGKISYSLYLWHWGVLAIARWTIGVSINNLPILIIFFFSSIFILSKKGLGKQLFKQVIFIKKYFYNLLSQIIIFYMVFITRLFLQEIIQIKNIPIIRLIKCS